MCCGDGHRTERGGRLSIDDCEYAQAGQCDIVNRLIEKNIELRARPEQNQTIRSRSMSKDVVYWFLLAFLWIMFLLYSAKI